MEAVAALALACNVVQVVDFGLKTASKCREIYNKGHTAEHQDLEDTSKHLAEITGNLSVSIQNAQTNKPLTKDDHELQSLAQRCTESANNLQEELDKLKSPGRLGKRAALLKTWQSMRKSNDIKRIKDKLLEHEAVLNTRLLSRLSERVDLLAVQQDDSFKTLDRSLQSFVNTLGSGYNQLSDLISQETITTRSTITQEHRDTRNHVTSNFQDMLLKHTQAQNCAEFLASLYYPEMKERQEAISDAHQRTFTWIFDRTGEGIRPWDDFVGWLEEGDGVYFLQGKAGSGKSTLMNYISADPRTMDSLNVWGQQSQVLILTFFFWNAGTKLQKSSLGLLRSLLYQILDHQQEIIPQLIKVQGISTAHNLMPTWTRKRIESSLKFVIDQISFPLCLFIDGLDEFDEGEDDLLQLISALQSRPSVKICASSRPSPCFINAFKHSAQLKLQDLTRRDIEIYVTDRFHRSPEVALLLQADSWRGNWLIQDVIAKAEGVFLWVELAVTILLKGLTKKDDWDMMKKRVDLLPIGIESLYIHMWNRLGEENKLYREKAALYFRIILLQETSLLQFAIATDENLQSTLLNFKSPPPATEDIISMCEDANFRVQARCAGFLEVDGFDDGMSATGEKIDFEPSSNETGSEIQISCEDESNKVESDEEISEECQIDAGGPLEDRTQKEKSDKEISEECQTDAGGPPEGRTQKEKSEKEISEECQTDADEPPEDRTQKDKLDEDEIEHHSEEDRFNEGGLSDEAGNDEAKGDPRLIRLVKRTNVRFIHRTARDFLLETKDGQAILGANPPLASSPHILLCKSKLSLDRLLLEPPLPSLLPDVFCGIRVAQDAESGTIGPLMNIIESHFSAKYATSSSSSIWSEIIRPAEDFLGLAAVHGIYLDLMAGFLLCIKRAGPDYTTYLLSCAVCFDLTFIRLELVLVLLTNGANSNKIFESQSGLPVSCWKQFLSRMWFTRTRPKREPSYTKSLHETVEAFLNNGVDLHESILVGCSLSHMIEDFSDASSGGKVKSRVIRLRCGLSARYVVAKLLHHDTQFSRIEERFESAGAQASPRLLSVDYPGWNVKESVSELVFQHISETLDKVLEENIEQTYSPR